MSQTIEKNKSQPSESALSRLPRLWKLIAYVTLGHLLAILILSPQFYCSRDDSPEALFARGEQSMAEGKPVEAMQAFRQVLDQQPKPPAIYSRAAEQHRLADRMARQAAGKAAAEAEKEAIKGNGDSKTDPKADPKSPVAPPTPATKPAPDKPKPDEPFIPPELRK